MKNRIPLFTCLLFLASYQQISAQEYVSPTQSTETGKAPGMKVKLVHNAGGIQTYVVVFSKGDEIKSGLTEFAQKYSISAAHFTGLGDATSAKVGWYDSTRKAFKVISLPNPSEISSITGNITMSEDKPGPHAHITLADENGMVHGGHLLELYVGPTVEIFVTVVPAIVSKQKDPGSGAALIKFKD